MFSEVPAVAELVIALDQLDAVAAAEGQFVGRSGGEVICGGSARAADGTKHVRTTISMSPGPGPSRAAILSRRKLLGAFRS